MSPMHTRTLATLVLAIMMVAAAVPGVSAQVNTSAVVGNAVPEVTDLAIPASVNPTAGSTTTVNTTATVFDGNGFLDLADVTITVYKADNTTVHLAAANATSNGDGSGVSQTYSHSFAMQFHDDPGVYYVKAVAEDAQGATSTVFTASFLYTELAALSLDGSSLDFGNLDPGVRSAVTSLSVTNTGNVQIDLDSSGADLQRAEGPESIGVARVKYDLSNANMSTEQSLTSTEHTNTGFDLAKGASSSKTTYWQLDTPSGQEQYLPTGAYAGTVSLSAISG